MVRDSRRFSSGFYALLRAHLRPIGQSWNKTYGMQARSGPMLRGQLAQEVDDFMAVQKNEHGFDLVRQISGYVSRRF